jgi:outer membrane protein OmpA-like peptidoglycan-associated protein
VVSCQPIRGVIVAAILIALTGCAFNSSSRNGSVPEVTEINVNNEPNAKSENNRLLHAFKAEGFNANISTRGVVAYIPGLFFEIGSSELVFDAREKIRFLAAVVQKDFVSDRKLVVVGHTDSTGDASSNMALSRRRAEKVMDELIFSAVRPDRIEIAWHGETQPVASNKNAAGRARNRRVEFIVLNK